jgi:CxxC motif-containing protein
MEVTYSGHKIIKVDNTDCKKGKDYAYQELFKPVRIFTSTVFVKNGHLPLVSVRTDQPIPKRKIFEVMKIISRKKVIAPVKIGDIIIKNVVNTGANIIATKNVNRKLK